MTIDTISTNMHYQNRNGQPANEPCDEKQTRDVETIYPLSHSEPEAAIDLSIGKKSLLRLTGDHSGEKISVEVGVVWITQSGSLEDTFLSAGESFDITQNGAVLVEGVARTCLKISRVRGSFALGAALGNAVQHILSSRPDRFV